MRPFRSRTVAGHSRRVAFLRIALPLAAVALVSVLIWAPGGDAPDELRQGVTVSDGESLRYSGRTEDGSLIDVVSESLLREDELTVIERVSAHMQNPDGSQNLVIAKSAEAENSLEYIDLKGGAVLRANTEFRIRSDGFRLSTSDSSLESLGEVIFEFQGGSGSAGRMKIVRKPSEHGDGNSWSFIEFTDGVEVTFLEFPESDP